MEDIRQCILRTIENALDGTGLMDYKVHINDENGEICLRSIIIKLVEHSDDPDTMKDVCVSWAYQDEHLGSMLLTLIQNIGK